MAVDGLSFRRKLRALVRPLKFNPLLLVAILSLNMVIGLLEGFGLSFVIPIFELAQNGGDVASSNQVLDFFRAIYTTIGVEFTLRNVIFGAMAVIIVRYSIGIVAVWMVQHLRASYRRHLQRSVFDGALSMQLSHLEREGSESIVNSVVTETNNAAGILHQIKSMTNQLFVSLVYIGLAMYLAPLLTLIALGILGALALAFRVGLQSAFTLGERQATANVQIQTTVQEITRGLPEVKVFGLERELSEHFASVSKELARVTVAVNRNQAIINKLFKLFSGLVLFGLIYAGLVISSLSLSALGVFLLAMYRLSPRVSDLTRQLYNINGTLPHVVRTYELIDELDSHSESTEGDEPVPTPVTEIAFEDVSFAYGDETVLDNVSFEVGRNEFVAFVGPSGAGKSTIASLVARLYAPDAGRIYANGRPIDEMPMAEWRSRISLVRQHPFIFNTTLRENLTIGNRDVDDTRLEWACEIAQVTEFLHELEDGFDTMVGEDGVRLSGGQRQRVAIARALLDDADLLVLDEATSDLDRDLEEKIQAAIESMNREYAVLTIAHRLSTVKNADRIHYLEGGRIIESGTHQELMGKAGEYADLYS